MATLYENYNTGEDNDNDVAGAAWKGQTFTPAVVHTITSVKIKAFRVGLPGTLTLSIRATDGSGLPTGSDLASGTYDADTMTTNAAGAWYEITLGAGTNLDANTKYAIVVRAPNGSSPDNRVRWLSDATSPTYSGGSWVTSADSGSSWSANTTLDFMFEDWGNPIPATITISEVLSLIEARNLTAIYRPSLQENLALSEIKSLAISYRQSLQESMTLTEQVISFKQSFSISLAETLILGEALTLIARIWSWISKNTVSWTHLSKSASPSWTHQNKSSSPSWTFQGKQK